jgi:hypothetical protein
MNCKGAQTLVPQIEENITELKWLNSNEIDIPLENTYSSIRDIIGKFMKPD